jgi:hypothetical protein
MRALTQAAFRKAHNAAKLIYDAPPKVVSYPCKVGAKTLTEYALEDASDGTKVYRSGKVGAAGEQRQGGAAIWWSSFSLLDHSHGPRE